MSNPIVTINISQELAPAPTDLQQTGAMISQGGTTDAVGTLRLLTGPDDIEDVLRVAKAITAMTWLGQVVTVTTTIAHGLTTGLNFSVLIAGVTPVGYNGTFLATVTGASTFTYPLPSNPGAVTVQGTYNLASASELATMVDTFFAQGLQRSVYVLEEGPGDAADGVAYLTDWLTDNPNTLYAVLVPRAWADEATYYEDLVTSYENLSSRLYFYTTVTAANRANFTSTMKSVFALQQSPDAPASEFTAAWPFWVLLNQAPTPTNKVPPMAFTFGFGVTPWADRGNSATFTTLDSLHVNYARLAAEANISNVCLFRGVTKDGKDALSYWYSVDWVQINVAVGLANAVVNGSNNKVNPLYFNQQGIDRLQARAAQIMSLGVSCGLVLGTVKSTGFLASELIVGKDNGDFAGQAVVNAVPFIPYVRDNPNDYPIGHYTGFTSIYTPQRGFDSIVYNIVVTDLVAS